VAEFDASPGGEEESAATPVVSRQTWRLVTIRVAIAVYWLTMFLATHLPVQGVMDQLPASDKHLHLGAYAVLGFALPWWSRTQHRRNQSYPVMLSLLLLAYASIDELLQVPVGRTAEWGDWLADAVGAALGLTVASWLRRD
jgi:VanZ family protein